MTNTNGEKRAKATLPWDAFDSGKNTLFCFWWLLEDFFFGPTLTQTSADEVISARMNPHQTILEFYYLLLLSPFIEKMNSLYSFTYTPSLSFFGLFHLNIK